LVDEPVSQCSFWCLLPLFFHVDFLWFMLVPQEPGN
jgi:hypothetical protein